MTFQFPQGDPVEEHGSWQIQPHHSICGMESGVCDCSKIAGDNPSVAVYQFRVLGHPLLVRGHRRLTPVVIVKVGDWQS